MKFSLSEETRMLIQQSTDLDPVRQRSASFPEMRTSRKRNRDYQVISARELAPRGSVYLQMGRVISFAKIKDYLKSI